METTTYVTLSAQSVLQRQTQIIANNIANLSTPAFKAEMLMMRAYEVETVDADTGKTDIALVQDISSVRDLSQGPMRTTDSQLDFAIDGEGYFALETRDGEERYTRHGQFQISPEGQIARSDGSLLLSEGGDAFTMPLGSTEVYLSEDGTISANTPTGEGTIPLGKIGIVKFENDYLLEQDSNSLMRAPEGANPIEAEEVSVRQGVLELSNVVGVVEMTKLIEAVRMYQMNGKVMEDEHERVRRVIQTLTETNGAA